MSEDAKDQMSLEEEKLTADVRLREADLALRERELQAKVGLLNVEKKSKVSPLFLAIVTAAAAISGSIIGSMTQALTEREKLALERQKFQSSLILQAVSSEKSEQRLETLIFLMKLRFLDDTDGNLTKMLSEENLLHLEPLSKASFESEPTAVRQAMLAKVDALSQAEAIALVTRLPAPINEDMRRQAERIDPLNQRQRNARVAKAVLKAWLSQSVKVEDYATWAAAIGAVP